MFLCMITILSLFFIRKQNKMPASSSCNKQCSKIYISRERILPTLHCEQSNVLKKEDKLLITYHVTRLFQPNQFCKNCFGNGLSLRQ